MITKTKLNPPTRQLSNKYTVEVSQEIVVMSGPSSQWWHIDNLKYLINSTHRNLWWRYMPGVQIKVKWPTASPIADPNYHYRDWLEKHVGRQGWDWNWEMTTDDVFNNTLTVKFRKGRERQAVIAGLMWT